MNFIGRVAMNISESIALMVIKIVKNLKPENNKYPTRYRSKFHIGFSSSHLQGLSMCRAGLQKIM
jgi:hypothetical protein